MKPAPTNFALSVSLVILSLIGCGKTQGTNIRSLTSPNSTRTEKRVHFTFAVYGDTRDGTIPHEAVVRQMLQRKPAFIVHTGDLVTNGGNMRMWRKFDAITAEMRKDVPFYPVRGNHDIGRPYFDRFTSPYASGNKLYYSFDHDGAHFIGLSVDEVEKYGPGSPQYKWLVQDLEAHKENKDVFVFFHVPPYSIGYHASDMKVRAALCPLFEKYHVRAVINGHDHNFYHTIRNGITYVVTGGGGAPLYPCIRRRGALPDDVCVSTYHMVVFDVDGSTVTGHAFASDGRELDLFAL